MMAPLLLSPSRFLVMTILCLGAARASAAGPAGAQASGVHPIAGKWTWTLPDKACVETLHYRTDGTRTGASGEEATQGNFQVTAKPSLLGFYRLTETVSVANGKPDCSGDQQAAGAENIVRYIQFNPKQDLFIVCKNESLQACYGPLQRAPE